MYAFCNTPVCSQGMMGDLGPKGLPQYVDMTHTGTIHPDNKYTMIISTY